MFIIYNLGILCIEYLQVHIPTHTHIVRVQPQLVFLGLDGVHCETSRSVIQMIPSSFPSFANQCFLTFAPLPFHSVDAFSVPSKTLFSCLEPQLPLLCFCFPCLRRLILRHASKAEVQERTAYGFLLWLAWLQDLSCGSQFDVSFLL